MKTILITGSTDGIGKLAASSLASLGHTVWVHGRNAAKVDATVEEIISATGNSNVEGCVADLADFDQIKRMGQALNSKLTQLDVLINNAGVFNSPQEQSATGQDIRFVVNYLAPVLLTNALLPLLQKQLSSRIINLSSAAQSEVSLKALEKYNGLSSSDAYAQSKLALTMWSFDLAKQLPETVVIAVNPGSLLNTRMVREAYDKHWSPADKGSKILVELATSSTHAKDTGRYFDNDAGHFGPAHDQAYIEIEIRELMEKTNELLGLA